MDEDRRHQVQDVSAGTGNQLVVHVPAASAVPAVSPPAAMAAAGYSADDREVISLWLASKRSTHTRRAYSQDVAEFEAYARRPLEQITVGLLQRYAAHVATLPLTAGSQHRKLAAVKSLFKFARRLEYLASDVAWVVTLPAAKNTLSERILDEADVMRLIAGESQLRNRILLQLLYSAGLRVSELAGLCWRDAQPHKGGATLTVFGKGSKTRAIRLEPALWELLLSLPGEHLPEQPIFRSCRGGALSPSQLLRIVRAAAKRAGITKPVSPHWLRHCHCSHALDHGEKLSIVQQTMGHASLATTTRYVHARPNESSSRTISIAAPLPSPPSPPAPQSPPARAELTGNEPS